ncbi:Fe-S cluster assembly protein SufD [bacterium]|nr:Fe-S cluster assembly protein SufD [bacterium]
MTTTGLMDDKLEALALSGPEWLADIRRQAWERYQRLELPDSRDEYWRYTDLKLIDPGEFQSAEADTATPVGAMPDKARAALALAGTGSAGRIVHVDGKPLTSELSEEARRAGVILTDIETAAREHEALLRPRLGRLVGANDLFTSWSLALHRGGTFLYVPPEVELRMPLQSLHWLSTAGVAHQPRTVVIVDRGAQVVFNDIYASNPLEAPTLVNPVTELYAGAGSTVGWVTWQDWGAGVRQVAQVKARLAERAALNTLLVTLGADYSRTWKECQLAGEGAESIMLGLYFPRREQRFEHWTVQDHAAPRTKSDLLYKGALADRGRAVYYGTIKVRPQAHGTDAYQANRNLTLSPGAKADTNPQLEIETNDVRCTHGATVGKVDPEQVFYLASRGIPRAEAERLLVFGFFNEVLERVKWSGMHELLAGAILAKLEEGA